MKNYVVSKLVTKFGFGLGIAIVALLAIGGLVGAGIKGLFAGAIIGAILAIPLLLFCEMAFAIVAIEENTRK